MRFLENRFVEEEEALTDPDAAIAHLVAQAKLGNSEAFTLLYRRFYAYIYDYTYRLLGSREEAEDATSTVFFRALSDLAKCRDDRAYAGWLHAIAHNYCYDLLRSRRSRQETVLTEDLVDQGPGGSLEERAILALQFRELQEARERCLTPSEREIFDLMLQDLNQKQIAAALGRHHGTIRNGFSALTRKLRECLGVVPTTREARHVQA